MPKKERQEEKKAREDDKKATGKAKASKDAEDAYWAAHGEGSKSKAAAKREEEEKKRLEQLAKKAELKKLQEEEEARMTATKSKLAPAGTQKVTRHQLDRQREIEEELKKQALQEKLLETKREVDESSYSRLVETENVNRLPEGTISASSVEGALAALSTNDGPVDSHPEKRMKAAWKAYEERMLPQLKQDKPGLKMSQYKDLLWKMWQKSPDNPMNQAAARA